MAPKPEEIAFLFVPDAASLFTRKAAGFPAAKRTTGWEDQSSGPGREKIR
jgi:hypothetical protein